MANISLIAQTTAFFCILLWTWVMFWRSIVLENGSGTFFERYRYQVFYILLLLDSVLRYCLLDYIAIYTANPTIDNDAERVYRVSRRVMRLFPILRVILLISYGVNSVHGWFYDIQPNLTANGIQFLAMTVLFLVNNWCLSLGMIHTGLATLGGIIATVKAGKRE